MKSTAIAPSNIAFIKYWGRKDEALRLPENGSIAMTLDSLLTTTTVEFADKYQTDQITINDIRESIEESKAVKHLDLIRKLAGINTSAKVVTFNNFPSGTGLSSSASGLAALTVAASTAAGLKLSEKDQSILARQGSGSACRSIPSGFVEWLDGDTSETSFAYSLYPENYWDIVDVVVVVSIGRKDVSTSEGQKLAVSSPFFPIRRSHMKEKITKCKELLAKKDFTEFGKLIEAEALEMHAIMLTSTPSLIYWSPGTLEIMKLTKKWRQEGLEVYFTINTGQDIHLIIKSNDVDKLKSKLSGLDYVKQVIVNKPAQGAHLVSKHLF